MSQSIKFVDSVQLSDTEDFEDAIIEIEHMDNVFYVNSCGVSIRIPTKELMSLLAKCIDTDEDIIRI